MGANEDQRAYWNRDEARHWVDHQVRYDEMLEPFGVAMLRAAEIAVDHHVVDIGCGNGFTTRAAARTAADGSALGLDLSEPMIERARQLAHDEGLTNVSFEASDAQTRRFEQSLDRAISRFGVMFFEDPVAAFTNIRSGLLDGGRVSFVAWQEMAANEWISVPAQAIFGLVAPPLGDPNAPGPYALANRDRVHGIFEDAGFQDIAIDPFSTPTLVGGHGTLDDAVGFMRNTGIAHALLDDKPAELQDKAIALMRDALEPHFTGNGVVLGGAAWIITARR